MLKTLYRKLVKSKKWCLCGPKVRVIERYYPVNDIPLASGGHTSFWMCECGDCHGFFGFPHDNLVLFVNKGPELVVQAFCEYFGVDDNPPEVA